MGVLKTVRETDARLKKSALEIVAGVRGRNLSDFEEEAVKKIQLYREVCAKSRSLSSAVSSAKAHRNVLAYKRRYIHTDYLSSCLADLHDKRDRLAYHLIEHYTAACPFFERLKINAEKLLHHAVRGEVRLKAEVYAQSFDEEKAQQAEELRQLVGTNRFLQRLARGKRLFCSVSDIQDALKHRASDLDQKLLGPANAHASNPNEMRFGRTGKIFRQERGEIWFS